MKFRVELSREKGVDFTFFKIVIERNTIWEKYKLRYKKEINPSDAEELAKDLKECAETSMLLDIRMEEIKNRINKSKIQE